MPIKLDDLTDEDILAVLISSEGNLPLATERICFRLELQYGSIKEYDLIERITKFDMETTDTLSTKLRTLLIVKLFGLISSAGEQLQSSLADLRPSELARAHASLTNTFAVLTAPAAKVTFDFEHEITKLAEEFKLPAEEIKGNLKKMEDQVRSR